MGILGSFTRRSLTRNRTRTIVSVIGIVLSTALMMAVFTTVTSLEGALVERVEATEGSWQIFDPAAEEGAEGLLASDAHVRSAIASSELGSSRYGFAEDTDPTYPLITVRTMPRVLAGEEERALGLAVMPEILEGSAPATEGEIMLPISLEGAVLVAPEGAEGYASCEGALAVDSTIELFLGTRIGEDGEHLTFMHGYQDADWGPYDRTETLQDVRMRSYRITGFYRDQSFAQNDYSGAESTLVALTSSDAPDALHTAVWIDTQGLPSKGALEAWIDPLLGEEDYYLHTELLTYQGIDTSSPISESLAIMAGTLAAVVVVAAVSLIYNSFAISVAERTRQFGLLSSLGASRRQLRRTVFIEALILGIVGIPLGVLLGIAGVAATLHATSDAFEYIFGISLTGGSVPVVVRPPVVILIVGLSCLVLVVSAWIPALRAGRVSAIDALRQAKDVKLDRRTRRRLEHRQRTGIAVASPSGLRERLFGIAGLLTTRNLSRANSKGRIVVASLAVSFLLLVFSGSIDIFLAPVTDTAGMTYGSDSPVDIYAVFFTEDDPDENSSMRASADRFIDAARSIEEVVCLGSYSRGYAYATFPSGIVDPVSRASIDYAAPDPDETDERLWRGVYRDGSAALTPLVIFVDDATWAQMSDAAPRHGSALLIDRYVTSDEGRYITASPYADTGSITLYSTPAREGYLPDGIVLDEGGTPLASMESLDGDGPSGTGKELFSLVETGVVAEEYRVVDLVDEAAPILLDVAPYLAFPTVILPAESFDASPVFTKVRDGIQTSVGYALASPDLDPRAAEDTLQGLAEDLGISVGFNNIAYRAAGMRAVVSMIDTFVFLFAFITMLIAIANVFNTLSNSIILRTREFALLQSCGMGAGDFARMLLLECAHYALRGLVWGLVLSFFSAWFLYLGSGVAFGDITFSYPWMHALGATLGVAAVLGISVIYALRRSRALNVVEALRADAI